MFLHYQAETEKMEIATTLTGSEKQIAWANVIRLQTLAAFTDEVGPKIAGTIYETAIQSVLDGKTEASWWIDVSKDVNGYHNVIPYYRLAKIIGAEVTALVSKMVG